MVRMQDILGQSKAIEVLQSALTSGRGHHAYIFHGPTGVGKFTTAWAFARMLLCHDAQPDLAGRIAACGSCRSCRLLDAPAGTAAAHPDLHVITKELARYSDSPEVRKRKLRSIPIEVVRKELLGPVSLLPQLGPNKVFIVDEADLLNRFSQSALLKALEEPPAGTYLILVTASEDELFATIRSRCHAVAFVPLPDQIVEQWLTRTRPELDEAHRRWLVGFADGSLGRTELAIEYDLFASARVMLPAMDQMAKGRYPCELGSYMAERIDEFAKLWVDRHEGASKDAANHLAAKLAWCIIGQHARAKIADAATRCDPADPVAAERMLAGWLGVLDAITAAESDLACNVNIGLVTEHAVSVMYRQIQAGV